VDLKKADKMQNKLRLVLSLAIFLAAIVAGCQKQKPALPAEKLRAFANALYNKDLFKQSIAEYERYLNNYDLSPQEQANVSYMVANIYFDKLHDYENALAYYLRIKELYPESTVRREAEKRTVECLERLQRSVDAQQALEEATFVDQNQVQKKRPGEVIARIGTREITTGDLDFEMKQLPPYALEQIKDKSKKLEFLKQYIATELLYDSAKRQGLDRDPEVIEMAFQAKKRAMVEKFLKDELSKNISVEEDDLQNYYRANQKRYARKDSTGAVIQVPLQQIREQVLQDYIVSKQKIAYNRLVERMMRAEGVQIFEDKIQ